ncbi:MAG TPA: C25 family cysteine peptidase, partial [Candidatus Cloacimonadota bacterium]|nr:C25 family cysteine peptidase [Candidatus Cloacimonadota bacterium]
MRQTAIIIVMLLLASILVAASLEEYQTTASGLRAAITELRAAPLVEDSSPDNNDGLDTVSYTSKTFALPYESVSLQINSMSWNVYDQTGTFLYTEDSFREGTAVVANSFTFRDMRGHTVKIRAQFTEGNLTRTLNSIDFSITGNNPVSIPESVSPAFVQSYKSLADNWETSYLRYLPVGRPQMLIISHAPLAPYQQDYINWRKQKGFEVYVLNRADLGDNVDQIKAGIAAHYAQYRPDYLLLFGDVTGTYAIPTAFFPSPEYQENDADDQTYTLLEGDDYFPDMLVGRFSFGNISELITMLNKTVSYEKTPYMDDVTWMRRALTVAGNFAEGTLRPTTPIHMSRWLRDRLLDYGYATVDTVFFPTTFPGTSLIQSSINQGLQYISYRGWGDANGWHYPSFHNPDLDVTFNGAKMPIVFSIVCNTGDFANINVNPCFGEKWMRMGTTAAPGGAIAFVGPSDLHTKTRLNNSISSGAFRAILDYDVRIFGSSILEGKIELYKNFPNDLAPDQYVPFYFHVYNLLSDPALNMWSLVPETIPESVFVNGLTYPQSATHIQINATGLDGAIITATKDGQNYSYAKVENGIGLISIDPAQTGELIVTISKQDMVPLQRTLTVTEAAALSLNSINVAPQGTNYTLTGFLRNNTTGSLTDIFVEAECYNTEMVNFVSSTWSIENLAANTQTEFSFGVNISEFVNPRVPLVFRLKVKRNNQVISTHLYSYTPLNAQFTVLNHTGVLPLGQNSPISFEIKNTGTKALTNASLIISSLTNAAVVSTTPIQIGAFAIGETKTINTSIQVQSDTYNGRSIPLHFQMNGHNVFFPSNSYSVVAGTPSSTDP